MFIVDQKPSTHSAKHSDLLADISEDYLCWVVEHIAIPRHYVMESHNNATVGKWIATELQQQGLFVTRQGRYGNIIATFQPTLQDVEVIIGAHFDSVPKSPGADDNASAVAGMLAAAKALALLGKPPVAFIAFNREEDGLLGSQDFVHMCLTGKNNNLKVAHILEMIGYYDPTPGSQHVPEGLPIKLSDCGDFIGVIGNRHSNALVSSVLKTAKEYVPDLHVKALKVVFGAENIFPHLRRSDHAPFWDAKLPAFMWTDTSEFRNPHYHQPSDTPDTLHYGFLKKVTALLTMHVAQQLGY